MDRALLLIFVFAVIGAGLIAGGAGYLTGSSDSWSPREYITIDGECFVRPQGDPLYDREYAQEVNIYNCQAYELQERAQNTEAVTRQIDWQTEQAKVGVFSLLFVVCATLGLLIVAIVRG